MSDDQFDPNPFSGLGDLANNLMSPEPDEKLKKLQAIKDQLNASNTYPSQAIMPGGPSFQLQNTPSVNLNADIFPSKEDQSLGPTFPRVSDKLHSLEKEGRVGVTPSPTKTPAAPVSDEDSEEETPKTPDKDYIKNLLGRIYGKDMGDDSLKSAMAARDEDRNRGQMMMIGSNLAKAISRGAYKPDNEVAGQIIKNSGQGVEDIKTRRAAVGQELETGLKASELEDKEKLRDPNSNVSQAYRQMALQLNPKLADQPDFEKMNAEGIKQLLPMVDANMKLEFLKMQKQQQLMDKFKLDSAKAKSEMVNKALLAMNRGAPTQAQQSVLAADKIMDLFKAESNPSKWNSSQVHLFNTETEKLAKGGIPSEHGTAKLLPPNIMSMLSKGMAFTTGNSVGTHQGEVIKSLVPYIQEVRKTSANFIRENVHNPLLRGYNKRLTPEDLEDYKSGFPSYVFPERDPKSEENSQMPIHEEVVQGDSIFAKQKDGSYKFSRKVNQ